MDKGVGIIKGVGVVNGRVVGTDDGDKCCGGMDVRDDGRRDDFTTSAYDLSGGGGGIS